ncbi:hypothetical protein AI29_08095 [bacteria symbiont BFo2 of Frankliniella occidentalis]|nr:hypothetical protein AI29_08095 [bacteria symbiont BFo2 of Frankliniella occidentalis]KYP88385.1 hypothetical protein WB60_10235 [bacteria symbiont BFo2 of Frankliniella occidentalis]KYP96725.1 hypothetical protein WB67_01030 [bacteria symbiont BFo2 of Frankliniella occidentalis]
MKTVSSFLLTAGLLGAVPSAYAVPNLWRSGFSMGVSEFIITDSKSTELNISCTSNPDESQVLQHSVLVTLPDGKILNSKDENTQIALVSGDTQFAVPPSLGWRNGDNAWIAFINAVRKTTSFEVWVNDRKVASFAPSTSNVHKVLADMSACTTLTAN